MNMVVAENYYKMHRFQCTPNAHSLIYHLTIDSFSCVCVCLNNIIFIIITGMYLINTIPYMTVSAHSPYTYMWFSVLW